MMKLLQFLIILLSNILYSNAFAATTTSTLTVNATVVAACSVVPATLNFGNYTLSQLDGTTNIVVTCTNNTSYSIGLDAGAGPSATTTARLMTASSNTLPYGLYKTVAATTIWGNSGGDLVSSTGTGAAQNFAVYGRIPAAQASPLGSYSDNVTITITY
jgi:spore coat protein U-like protein